MKLLGITGGIGAGKSLVTQCFKDLGATVVDADEIARQLLSREGSAYEAVVHYFGNEILHENKDIKEKYIRYR